MPWLELNDLPGKKNFLETHITGREHTCEEYMIIPENPEKELSISRTFFWSYQLSDWQAPMVVLWTNTRKRSCWAHQMQLERIALTTGHNRLRLLHHHPFTCAIRSGLAYLWLWKTVLSFSSIQVVIQFSDIGSRVLLLSPEDSWLSSGTTTTHNNTVKRIVALGMVIRLQSMMQMDTNARAILKMFFCWMIRFKLLMR